MTAVHDHADEHVIDNAPLAAALRTVETGMQSLRGLDTAAVSNRDRLALLVRLERIARTVPALGHTVVNQLLEQRAADEFGGTTVRELLADTLRISPAKAGERIHAATELGAATTLGGQPLEPKLAATAAAAHHGDLDPAHVDVIREFLHQLPAAVDAGTRHQAEAQLAGQALILRPDELRAVARRLASVLDPDGTLDDETDRARKRYFRMGPQGRDKMTNGSFCTDPEGRAYLEAIMAKLAKPGMCNPEGEGRDETQPGSEPHTSSEVPESSSPATPTADTQPTPSAAARDHRTQGQRQHDALKAVLRSVLASGELGRHRGVPVTVVATMTARDLQDSTGHAVTGGGTLVPMPEMIRMAARGARHYLAIFDDDGRPLYLGRSKRLGTTDQRIVLYAKDRGCTFPGCSSPGYWSQTHHVNDWADGGDTNADDLPPSTSCREVPPPSAARPTTPSSDPARTSGRPPAPDPTTGSLAGPCGIPRHTSTPPAPGG
nr:HNH endonuclease signature motif containing protein [Rhodococcus tukisamuensis]